MNELYLAFTIVVRSRLAEVVSLSQESGISVNHITLGSGTATNETMNFLGLDSSEKAVCLSVVTDSAWKKLKRGLEQRVRIDVPSTGIAFTVPLSSIGGKRELAFLTENQDFERREESTMKGTTRELLIVICNQGYNELVMDAARAVGAAGGTIIHARGTGMERAERFLGVSLAAEKDIIFIVTKTSEKNQIMEAIMRKAGMETRAKAIVFSLPVTSTAGLRLLDEPEEASPQA